MPLNYHHLRYFWAVAHDGNLTRTAQRLNLSQSALSVQIKQLEERLGHALFDRRGRQLHLTEAGRIALDHADAIFSTGQELVATLEGTVRDRKALRVGALATLSRNFQIGFLRPILSRLDVEVILRSGSPTELLEGLGTLNLDLVLMNRPPPDDSLTPYETHQIGEQEVSIVGAPERLDPDRPIRDLLAEQPFILPTTDSSVRTAFDAMASRLSVRPQIAAEVDDMAMMRLLARENIGLALVAPIVVKDELTSGRLVEANEHPRIKETFFAITQRRRFPNALVQDLLERNAGSAALS
ncbi:LysR family transcriptional regulator [Phaeobacter gallaeciensis]|jgi:LysR family transcriptional activator of nhaA|uniref:LysR family transcriptional regulator n=1 Tax=Phaeobacter gallaeciensis TaxID=60890 RepID=A0ABD4XE14_9RHOB|nr:LysR family transcriptional regulator [Phaeobacter gallaeciensis]MDF1770721.1 LysR family transcriptional regulator [Pseudophaeobacter sp. bin_em_oilr2.035]MDE4146680.1 LysR family transcriptional regulator [Phaeobacter gallaeciensis]MDE4159353.1 LysR family transcriptional regulator [Phaeobacter gallaeciensis]MDE4163532.1 LysR family transcriptional regulator [Phaeobacter gallaeciensis]MDE4167762.1 LysR family transcriptional regulator [Phaeobacter gallaeciensis]